MLIINHGEEQFELNERRNRKLFLSYVKELAGQSAQQDLLDIIEQFNHYLFSIKIKIKHAPLIKLYNEVLEAYEITVKNPIETQKPKPSTIGISFRQDAGTRMHGAFFDHYVFRNISHRRTHIIASEAVCLKKLQEFSGQSIYSLNLLNTGHKIIPKRYDDSDKDGLLIIPGRSRQEEDAKRQTFELELIRKARLRGQPVLAICAGSWTLWNAYGGQLKAVHDHVYSSMPYIVTDGSIGNNKQIHELSLNPSTMLHSVMTKHLKTNPRVNSLHWMAADESSQMPSLLEISARSKRSSDIEVLNRQGKIMASDEGSVEAFETKYGAPMIGIQWHPECYFSKTDKTPETKRHLDLIHYMIKAGDAYQAKQQLLAEIKSSHYLRQLSVFKTYAGIHELKLVSQEAYHRPMS